MTLRHIDRRLKKWFKERWTHFAFTFFKRLFIKKKVAYWKKFPPASTDGYPIVDTVWDITINKLTNVKRIRYCDLYGFYFKCFNYYLHFYHKSYIDNKSKIEAIKEHDKYVNYLYDQEKKRQDTIDSKAKQIITNTSTVITIIGLFVTILTSFFKGKIDINNSDFYQLIAGLFFLFISLLIAISVLNFKKYSRPIPEITFKPESKNEETFLRTKITSFHVPIILNTSVNSKKSNQLIFSTYTYIIALILVLWLATKNIYILTKNQDYYKTNNEKELPIQPIVNISIDTKSIDSTLTREFKNLKKDTVKVKIMK